MEGSQTLFNIVLGLGLSALGWAARTLYDSVRELQSELAEHKVEVAKTYATNIEVTSINNKLDEILRYLRDQRK